MGLFSRIASWLRPGDARFYKPDAEDEKRLVVPQVPYLQTLTAWKPSTVLAALDAHELGDFSQSGLLWQWCAARDDRLRAVLHVRASGLPSLPFAALPATPDRPTPEEEEAAALLEAGWFDIFPESTVRALFRAAVGMGVVAARVRMVTGHRGLWWPRLTVWPPEALRYDDNERCFYAQARNCADVKITPGEGWFLWQPDGPRGFQLAAVLALALPCLISNFTQRDWANYSDAHGHPVAKASVPRGAKQTEKDAFVANLKALDSKTKVLLTQKNLDGSGFDFEWVSLEGKEVNTFERALEQANKAKAILLLGQSLTTDVADSGSRALGAVHNQIRNQILKSDAEGFVTAVREQIVKPWARYNLGAEALAPWPRYDHKPPADRKAEAETHVIAASAVTALQGVLTGTGKRLDTVAYLERLELPLEEEAAAEAKPAAPQNGKPAVAPVVAGRVSA
jgi:phage gp29-like protein